MNISVPNTAKIMNTSHIMLLHICVISHVSKSTEVIRLQDLLEYLDLYSSNLAVHGMAVYNLLFIYSVISGLSS